MKHFSSLMLLAASACSLAQTVEFACVGDFGVQTTQAQSVADLIHSWNPEIVITTGDNNYPVGAASTIDPNIGKYYARYIHPYTGAFGPGATTNRFFPSLGNHDWGNITNNPTGANPYLAYFALPGNERYYDFVRGPVHFFALDSDNNEPDGKTATSIQGLWLKQKLKESTAPFRVVYWHHPAFSSGSHGSQAAMQWPFAAWGATTGWSGHEHSYERILRDDFQFIVNGNGGQSLRAFNTPVTGSIYRDGTHWGAQKVSATSETMTSDFVGLGGTVFDTISWNARPVSGSLTLEDYSATLPTTVVMRFQKGAVITERTATVSPNGDYVCYPPVGDGAYSISVKPSHWLRKTLSSVTISATGATGVNFQLRNGDCVEDNVVDLSDYTTIATAFNAQPGEGNWVAAADLNGDFVVDLTDYTVVAVNFNAIGD